MNFSIQAISFLVTFCMLVLPATCSDLDGHVAARSLGTTYRKKSTFSIKLTPENEIDPFVGIDNAFGTAVVQIKKKRACIDGTIYGFFPMAAHIHFRAIDENGDVIVDFTSLIRMGDTEIQGCVPISQEVSERILGRPVRIPSVVAVCKFYFKRDLHSNVSCTLEISTRRIYTTSTFIWALPIHSSLGQSVDSLFRRSMPRLMLTRR